MHAPLSKLPAKMPSERSRSRRERRGEAARRPVLHVVAPGLEVTRETPRKGETVTAFLRRTGWATRDPKYGWQFRKRLPTILEINGEPVLRKQWRRTKIAANDNVRFVSFPRGGNGNSGKQVLGLVALVAVAAFAAWAGPALAAAYFGGSAIAGSLLTGAIGLGGALLVSSLTSPKQGATNDPNASTDQIYTAQSQGNVARLGQPLPIWYGRNKDYPDLAARAWGEFVANDQYLNILLSVSMGLMEYEQMTVVDTPFWNPIDGVLPAFSSATVEFYDPGEPVTLFPINVAQSEEVSGQQLPHGAPGAWIGPFVASPAGEKAYQLAVDFVFPAGCFTTDDDGNTASYSVGLTAERQAVNDAGAPIGDWVTLASATRTYANRSPIRDTFLVGVPEGRYQVRFRTETDVPPDNKGAADVIWAGLRAYLRGDNSFPDVSTIAIRIKASESTQGSFKFGVIGTRKLPVWNGSTFVMQATRSPAWALLDMATNEQYGAEVKSAKVDFNAIVNHAAGCTARGDNFDYVFKSAVAAPAAFDTAVTVSRARHMWLGDTLSLVRDEWSEVPTMMLTDREIVRNSTSLDFTMLGPEDPDAVIIEYIDQDTWLPATVQYPPDTEIFTAVRADTKRVDGIVNRDHAYREAAFYYLCSIYRREAGGISCEYEGRAITMGSNLRLQSELPQNYGQAGAVIDQSGTSLTLSPMPSWAESGAHFIRLRRPNGKEFGPVGVTKGANNNIAVLDAGDLALVESQQGITLANVLARPDGAEFPTFDLGTADNQSKIVKVLTGQPNGETFNLTVVVDDIRVHSTDLGDPPMLPIGQFPKNDSVPLIVGLSANYIQGVAEPQLNASWFPAAGAFYYRGEVSYDEGKTWSEVYQGQSNSFEKFVTLGALRLRVQAIGQFPGPYAETDVEAPTIEIMSNAVALRSLQEGIRYNITELENKSVAELTAITDAISQQLKQIAAKLTLNKEEQNQQSWDHRIDLLDRIEVVGASIKEVRTVAENTEASFAQYQITINAQIGDISSTVASVSTALSTLDTSFSSFQTTTTASIGSLTTSVSATQSSIATINGVIGSQYTVTLTTNGYATGFNLINGGAGISSFTIVADKFQIQLPGYNGSAPMPFFTTGTVAGVPAVGMRGNFYLDGTFNVNAINAGGINTVQLAVGSVDINTLIKGAATRSWVDATPVITMPASGPATTVWSRTVEVLGGQPSVMFAGHWQFLTFSSHTGMSVRMIVRFLIDGAEQQSYEWNVVGNGSTNGFAQPFCLPHTFFGVSAGNHTLSIVTDGGGASVADSGTADWLSAGQVTVTDLRR